MIKGLRPAFVEELRVFDGSRRIHKLFRVAGIYTCEKSQISKAMPNKDQRTTKLDPKERLQKIDGERSLDHSKRSLNKGGRALGGRSKLRDNKRGQRAPRCFIRRCFIYLALFARVDSDYSEEFVDPTTSIEDSQLFSEGKS